MFYRTRSCPAYSDISAVPRHWLQWVHSLRAAAPPCQDLSPFHRNMASSEWLTCLSDKCCSDLPFIVKQFHSASTKCISSLKQLHNDRVSAACGNTGNLLECPISLGNTGNLLVFNWCSCKFFLANKRQQMSVTCDGHIYCVNRITVLSGVSDLAQ